MALAIGAASIALSSLEPGIHNSGGVATLAKAHIFHSLLAQVALTKQSLLIASHVRETLCSQ